MSVETCFYMYFSKTTISGRRYTPPTSLDACLKQLQKLDSSCYQAFGHKHPDVKVHALLALEGCQGDPQDLCGYPQCLDSGVFRADVGHVICFFLA